MSRARLLSLAVAAGVALGSAREARANVGDTLLAIGYVGSLIAGGLATAVNGSYLAFGEPAPRGWRWFGLGAAGVDFVWSGVIIAVANDRTEGVVLGAVAAGVGTAALLTALFVDEDRVRPGITPVITPAPGGGAMFGVVGRF